MLQLFPRATVAALALALGAAGCAGAVASTSSRSVRQVDATRIQGAYAPAGQHASAQLDGPVDTLRSRRRDGFTARLTSPLLAADGSVFAPAGALVRGRVASLGSVEYPRIRLEFDSVETAYGPLPMEAAIRDAQARRYSGPTRVEPVAPRAFGGGPLGTTIEVDGGYEARASTEIRLPANARLDLQLTRPILAPGTTVAPR